MEKREIVRTFVFFVVCTQHCCFPIQTELFNSRCFLATSTAKVADHIQSGKVAAHAISLIDRKLLYMEKKHVIVTIKSVLVGGDKEAKGLSGTAKNL